MTLFVLNLLALSAGLAATLAWFLVFHLAGLALMPRRWHPRRGQGGIPPVLGAAAYVLTCWFGIERGTRLTPLAFGFTVVVLALLLVRSRAIVAALKAPVSNRDTPRWIALFVGLYVLVYLFTLPPASSRYLPLAWLGNVDVFQYLVYAHYLLHLGPSPISDVSTSSYVYFQTPGTFFILDAISLLFGQEPMRAAMPALLAAASLAGVAAGYVSRRVFGLSFTAAAAVGAIVVSGPFFRFIAGHYYLSTLLAIPVLVHLLLLTVTDEEGDAGAALERSLLFLAHYVLLLFVYPYLLLIAVLLQAAAVASSTWWRWRTAEAWPALTRKATAGAATIVLALLALFALVPKHVLWTYAMYRELSHTGLWGWATDVISPFALVGMPWVITRTHAEGPVAHATYFATLWFVGAALLLASLRRAGGTRESKVFLGLAGVGFLAYVGYFSLVGPSYQQWKLASYIVLPLAFVLVAWFLGLLVSWIGRTAYGQRPGSRLATAAVALVCAALVGGNAITHAAADPGFRRLPGDLRNLAQLGSLPFRDLSIEVNDTARALLVSYFLPTKRLHVSMPAFYSHEPLALDGISPARPLLALDYSCEGIGHRDVRPVEGVGCLALRPPSLVEEDRYPFSRTYMFIQPNGLGAREDWGRWNRRAVVELKLLADPRHARVDSNAWLNLLLQPCLVPGVAAQRIRLKWGAGRHAEAVLGERGWISLPLRGGDWSGDWLAAQTVTFEFPDIVPPHWVDGRYLETRSLAVGFLELSVGASPRGRAVLPVQ